VVNKLILQFSSYYQIGANILCGWTAVKCEDRDVIAMQLTKSLVIVIIYNEVPYLPECKTTLISGNTPPPPPKKMSAKEKCIYSIVWQTTQK